MALSIESDEAHRLARALVAETGETITEAVVISLRERLDRACRARSTAARRLALLADEVAAMVVADARSPDEIVGYDEHGLPT